MIFADPRRQADFDARPDLSGFFARYSYKSPADDSDTITGVIIKAPQALFDKINPHTDLHFRGGLMGINGVLILIVLLKVDDETLIEIPYNAYETPDKMDSLSDIALLFEPMLYAFQLASQDTLEITFTCNGVSKTFVKRNPVQRVFEELIKIITNFEPWDDEDWGKATASLRELYGNSLTFLWERCDLSRPENHSGDVNPGKPQAQYRPPTPARFSTN